MTLEEIWRRVPDVHCRGKCQECCGPIGLSHAEFARVKERVGDKLEALSAMSFGDLGIGITGRGPRLGCPLLVNGRCSIYEIRPLICRIWGAIKAMRCPHGCRPKRWLKPDEAHALLSAAEQLDSK